MLIKVNYAGDTGVEVGELVRTQKRGFLHGHEAGTQYKGNSLKTYKGCKLYSPECKLILSLQMCVTSYNLLQLGLTCGVYLGSCLVIPQLA